MIPRVFCRLGDADVATNNPHTDGTTDCTNKQQLSSSELVYQEQQPYKGHDGFDDTKNASHQVHSVTFDTNTLRIVIVSEFI